MRRFQLHRDEDETGTSGTGVVVEGCEFTSGVVALTWVADTDLTSWCWYPDMRRVEAIHGHGGKTRVVWIDPTGGGPVPSGAVDALRAMLAAHPEWNRYPLSGALAVLEQLDRTGG